MRAYLFIALMSSSYCLQAVESEKQGLFFTAGIEGAVTELENENSEAFGLEAGLSYYFNQYVGASLSYGEDFNLFKNDVDNDFQRIDGLVIGRLPLSEYAGINLGIGGTYAEDDFSPLGQLMIDYKLSPNSYITAGYKFYVEPADKDENITAFNIGFQYQFNKTPVTTVVAAPTPKPEPIVEPLKEPVIVPVPPVYVAKEPVDLTIYFDFDSITTTPKSAIESVVMSLSDLIADTLKAKKTPMIEIYGYADPVGQESYNFQLSLKRAHTIEQQLLAQGIPANYINVVKGKGELISSENALSRKAVITYQEH
ncbi:OmpA family protein [Pseudoalteromonas haloplanktis]|uniref:OmpA family protein n=1 Tax=Pseudoalteromonas haloplanktis TaxID=228 RepID=A0ABU1BCG7_PSEHA|nr:OmpA family protein [Pseudoalteromonas haloplanktis]MDQ9091302.1 OmpA family protein [Pseudoalteromonas haloplanktis]